MIIFSSSKGVKIQETLESLDYVWVHYRGVRLFKSGRSYPGTAPPLQPHQYTIDECRVMLDQLRDLDPEKEDSSE